MAYLPSLSFFLVIMFKVVGNCVNYNLLAASCSISSWAIKSTLTEPRSSPWERHEVGELSLCDGLVVKYYYYILVLALVPRFLFLNYSATDNVYLTVGLVALFALASSRLDLPSPPARMFESCSVVRTGCILLATPSLFFIYCLVDFNGIGMYPSCWILCQLASFILFHMFSGEEVCLGLAFKS